MVKNPFRFQFACGMDPIFAMKFPKIAWILTRYTPMAALQFQGNGVIACF